MATTELAPTTTAIRTQARVKQARSRRPLLLTLEIGVPALLIAVWWFGSLNSADPFFPPLRDIVIEFQRLWLFDKFFSDVLPSVGNFLVAYVIACLIGVALGTALGLIRPLFWILDPIVQFVRSIPAVALLPIFVATMGFGNEVRVFAIALASLFPILISTIDGVRGTEPLLLETARVYRLSAWERLRRVYLPAASPQIFAGALVSLQVAFIVMITSEMLGAARGIGALTLLAQKSFDVRGMWAGILLLGILGFLANLCFNLVRRRALAWYLGSQKAASAD
ncbi:ABC-type nitrate/sulfonate/bicarbonate transport system permease component [Leucobacter luti]|uniref:ABC transporter permease n=1 Tax=Leucobacter luti TaxID=340320 RepID=UPI00104F1176|nr:ABC transporter permease [Leucobacter luti]MCW2288949.1 ABC-type nitrate/sulfonate/bicarbonate transport system permease component [Leucobacter luti]TCK44901.1 ABC-type nitrate/sulfonate/bicarbonate transport system permease component [Leucobacter luti]